MLPVDHTTSVHHLRDWKLIGGLHNEAAITNKHCVMEEETNRGCLGVHDRGEGSRSKDGDHER